MILNKKAALAGLAVIAAVTLAISGCSSSGSTTATGAASTSPGKCTTRFLYVTNVTGSGSINGTSNVPGIKVAQDFVNSHGGVLGCKLQVDVKDDGSDYTKDLPLVQQSLAQNTYVDVDVSDFGCASAAPFVTRAKILGVFSCGVQGLDDPKTNPYLFDTVINSADSMAKLGTYAVDKGAKKVAIVGDTSAVGQTSIAETKTAVQKAGGTVSDTESVDLSSVNMTPVVQRLQASGADTLVVNLFGAAAGYFFRDLDSSGWKVKKYGSTSVFASNVTTLDSAAAVKGLTLLGPTVSTSPTLVPVVDTFIKDVKKSTAIGQSLALYAQANDAVIIAAFGINGAKSSDAAKVALYLSQNGSKTVPGLSQSTTTNYSATNHEAHFKKGLGIVPVGPLVDGRYSGRTSVLNG